MRLALRPYVVIGAALAGAGVIVLAPGAPPLPDVQVPAVQPAGTELNDFNVQDFLNLLPAPDALPSPENAVPDPSVDLPDLGGLPNSVIAPPDLGRLELNGPDLGAALSPSNLAVPPFSPPAVP